MDQRSSSFRLIFAIREVSQSGTFFRLTIAGTSKTCILPLKEALVFDLPHLHSDGLIEFDLENEQGEIFGYTDMRVPSNIYSAQETEIDETIRIRFGDSLEYISMKIYLVFLNKGIFREKARQKSTPGTKSHSKLPAHEETGIKSANISTEASNKKLRPTPSQDRLRGSLPNLTTPSPSNKKLGKTTPSPSQKNVIKGKSSAAKQDDSYASYLNQVVNKHSDEISPQKYNEDVVKLNAILSSPSREKRFQSSKGVTFSPLPDRNQYSSLPVSRIEEYRELSPERLRERAEIQDLKPIPETYSPSRKQATSELAASLDRANALNSYQKAQIDNLKNVILNLDTKLRQYEILKNENEIYRLQFERGEESRKELQQSIIETTNELKNENTGLLRQVHELIREKADLVKKHEEASSRYEDARQKLSRTQINLDKQTNDYKELESKLVHYSSLQSLVHELENNLAVCDAKRADDQINFVTTLRNLEKSLEETRSVVSALSQEKKELLKELNEVKTDLSRERAEHLDTQRSHALNLKRLENTEKQREVIKSLQEQREDIKKQLNEVQSHNAELNIFIEKKSAEIAVRDRELESLERKYTREISLLNERISLQDQKESALNNEIRESRAIIAEHRSNISGLEQLLCIKEDISRQLDASNQKLASCLKDKEILNSHLEALGQSQSLASSRALELEREVQELKNQITEKEEYNLNLKKLIIEMKEKQPLYVPKRDDRVDVALADYINSQSDPGPLRVLFMRESEGVYNFGTKRVFIKVEGEKILVRVGGGYLLMDEFIDTYFGAELERIAKGDTLKILQRIGQASDPRSSTQRRSSPGRSSEKYKTVTIQVKDSPTRRMREF